MQALERLVNLVVLLLEARLPLTFEQIRERMGDAYEQGNLASAKRMFERDKDLARDFGVPIELENVDAWETEQGYVIRKDRYYLPEIAFTPEEVSALFLAAQGGGPDDPAAIGVRKLLSAAADDSILGNIGGLPGIADSGEPRLAAAATALADGRAVRFSYRPSTGDVAERTMDPFGLTFRGGHWYLVGHDRDRADVRAFRLSRILSDLADAGEAAPRPEGFSAAEAVAVDPWGPEVQGRARIAFAPETRWLAQMAVSDSEVNETLPDGWVVLSVPAGDPTWLASWVLSFGSEAVVLDPEPLRAEVVRRLQAVAGG